MQPLAMVEYKYHPLPGEDHIRLLTIHPGKSDDQIILSLISTHFPQKSPPDYEALSYTWGSQENLEEVSIQDGGALATIRITQNLAVALRHLRYSDRPRVMWIDALCIEQTNDVAKGTQVAMMGEIYRLATRVVAWLGPEQDDSDHGLERMAYLGSQVSVNWVNFILSPAEDCVDKSLGNRDLILPFGSRDLTAIYHILSRPWFRRLWIRQEIFLASSESVILCGHCEISWLSFRRACVAITHKQYNNFSLEVELYNILSVLYGFIFQPFSTDILSLRRDFQCSDCLEPRDRVYAIISLLDKNEKNICPHPNYTKSVVEVYQEVTVNWIDYYGAVQILCACELQASAFGISWVPDWSAQATASLRNCQIEACSNLGALNEFPETGVLRVTGVSTTVIEDLQQVPNLIDFAFEERLKAIRGLIEGQRLDEQYCTASGSSKAEAYARVLLCNVMVETAYPNNSSLPELEEAQKFLTQLAAQSEFSSEEFYDGRIASKFLAIAVPFLSRKQFIRCASGYIGIAPPFTQAGDHVCVLLGCNTPIVLRRLQNGRFLVVGECYVYGISNGEALLGSLPPKTQMIKMFREDLGFYASAFVDEVSGKISFEDPRLESLGVDLSDFRDVLEEHGRAVLRVDLDILREKGVDVTCFDLV